MVLSSVFCKKVPLSSKIQVPVTNKCNSFVGHKFSSTSPLFPLGLRWEDSVAGTRSYFLLSTVTLIMFLLL